MEEGREENEIIKGVAAQEIYEFIMWRNNINKRCTEQISRRPQSGSRPAGPAVWRPTENAT